MIVVAGEALIDLVPTGPGPLAPLTPTPGGGPHNTAVALGRLGSPTAFCSRVSLDPFGEALLDRLRGAGVDVSSVQRGPEPTSLALASVADEGSAGYGFYVEGTADRLFTGPVRLPPDCRAVAFGTCSLVLEPGASTYEEVLRQAAREGLLTMLDPNVRTALIDDPDRYRTRFREWLPSVSLLKLSTEDAAWLGGSPREWLRAGPAAVVVTRGAEGMTVHTRDGGIHSVPGRRVPVVDTIGAGDTVNAALLHGLAARGALAPRAMAALGATDWRELLGFAARAAAVTCSREGADPPYPDELAG
ncbi:MULTISPECIES: carbohydrate kinase family protein [unclassified Streptomyces]|uniref:carbohydrate kinase family protein n=1 Tax=unclassified Streptomyces TaxID=2593676 RepID=UPI001905F3C5|nr:carbohydrate kinase [Streptomyces sp. HSG2]